MSTNDKVLLDVDPNELTLSFAGNVVKHLGVQMYAGRPVPAIAELISNSWDADAAEVELELPLGAAWDSKEETHVVRVSDDGIGMDWQLVRDDYLDVGRDRRATNKTDRSPGGRRVQGRKGLGKLAGFGIADVVEVQTVHEAALPELGEQALIWFRLSMEELAKAKRTPAPVEVLYAGPVSRSPSGARATKGTTVTLHRLHSRKAINAAQFRKSMTRRFLMIGPKFRLTVNNCDLEPETYPLQWRWPEDGGGWLDGDVKGCGPVRYWIGFSKKPRQQSEGDLSGFLIYTRDKVSQEATFFDISGGVTGQHGLRYMCGMVQAEWLDNDSDLIATHRGAIAWESPQGGSFQEWGRQLVREYLAKWAKLRSGEREDQIRALSPNLQVRIDRLAGPYKEVASKFVDKFKSVEMELEEFEAIFSWFLDALENATLRSILEKLKGTDITHLESLDDLLSKMEVRTAVALLQIIESNLAAIAALERMHREDASERDVISKHIKKNPWLIHPSWMLSKAEGRVSTWIKDNFGLEPKGDVGDEDRADFFCVAVGGTLHIVEIKRGAHIAIEKDLLQANKYREYVLKRFSEISDPEAIKYDKVASHLVSAELHPSAKTLADSWADRGIVFFTTWDDLLERAKVMHQQFRDVLEIAASEENGRKSE